MSERLYLNGQRVFTQYDLDRAFDVGRETGREQVIEAVMRVLDADDHQCGALFVVEILFRERGWMEEKS